MPRTEARPMPLYMDWEATTNYRIQPELGYGYGVFGLDIIFCRYWMVAMVPAIFTPPIATIPSRHFPCKGLSRQISCHV